MCEVSLNNLSNLVPYTSEGFYCELCNVKLEYGVGECYNCHTDFDDAYWHEAVENLINDCTIRHEDEIDNVINRAEDRQICCEQDYTRCDCDVRINAPDVYDAVEPHWYADDTECMSCVFVSSPACPPLRAFYKKLRETGEVCESITPCGSFRLATLFKG